jgi:CRISPR-associated protein Csb2
VHTLTSPPPAVGVTGLTTVVHLALDPMPPLHRVAEVTSLLRAAALARLGPPSLPSPLSGYGTDGRPASGHRHAHWLPVTCGSRIAGICAWIPAGLSPAQEQALAAVTELGGRPGSPWLRVCPVPGDCPLPARLAGPSAAWVSLTPFVPPRFTARGRRQRRHGETIAGMAAGELTSRGLPAPASVSRSPAAPWPGRPSRPGALPPQAWLHVTFTTPVTGPLAIGRLSHFGLGLLAAA